MHALEIRAAAEALQRVGQIHRRAEQQDGVARVLEPLGGDVLGLFDDPHHCHRGRRIDGTQSAPLIVEGNIAPGDRSAEGPATIGQTANRLLELPEDFRVVGIAEVEVVGRTHRHGPGAGQIAASLGDGGLTALIGVEVHVATIAIHGEGHVFVRQRGRRLEPVGGPRLGCGILGLGHRETVALDADHRSVTAGANYRAVADHVVVLAINPVLGGDGVVGKQSFKVAHRVAGVGDAVEPESANGRHVSRLAGLAVVHRSFVSQLLGGHIHDHLAPVTNDHATRVGHHADLGPRQIPLVENRLHLGFTPLVDHDEHALLGFGEHDLVAGHVRSPLRDLVQLDLDARSGAGSRLASGAGQTRRTHVLHAGDTSGGQQFQAGLADELLHERIAHLDRPALLLG